MYLLSILSLRQHTGDTAGCHHLFHRRSTASGFIHIFYTKLHRFILLGFILLSRLEILLRLNDLFTRRDQIILQFRDLRHQTVQL